MISSYLKTIYVLSSIKKCVSVCVREEMFYLTNQFLVIQDLNTFSWHENFS